MASARSNSMLSCGDPKKLPYLVLAVTITSSWTTCHFVMILEEFALPAKIVIRRKLEVQEIVVILHCLISKQRH